VRDGAAGLDLSRPSRIHVVGVGGSGMNAIAQVLAAMGHTVTGSDLTASPVLERLRGLGVDVRVGHRGEHVVSTAVPPTNPEVTAARARGIPVLRRADVLAAITRERRTIAVAGTHGKTTTSALLAMGLFGAGMRPSFIVGGDIAGVGSGARWDVGEWLVVEADESDGTFLDLDADVAVVTSVEPDHLDHYGTFDALVDAFDRFLATAPVASLVCADDPVAAGLGAARGSATYGFDPAARVRIEGFQAGRAATSFTLAADGRELGPVRVPLPGRHNARNAAGAIAAALGAGARFDDVAGAVAAFAGVGRRAQVRGERGGVTYLDDYAHLPGEVRAVLGAAVEGRWDRIVCVFQPHRYSRTEALWADFGPAFQGADVVVVTEVYAAGERPRPGVSGRLVADAVRAASPTGRRVEWRPGRDDLAAFLRAELRPGDLCLTLGAGDLTTLPDELLSPARQR
jgi:UDP-N-acetylmuramate--alanine ligase